MTSKKNQSPNGISDFDSITKRLESIIDNLETDETSLEDALGNFEEGIKLLRNAQKIVDQASQKVSYLLDEQDTIIAEDVTEAGEEA